MTKLALALDVQTMREAIVLTEQTRDSVDVYKVGLELFTRYGPSVLGAAKMDGCEVFLDLKLHDIPNTMAGAVRSALAWDVDYLTVHAAAGEQALRACAKAAEGTKLNLAAISVLTSLESDEIVRGRLVEQRARTAFQSHIPCLVCAVGDLVDLKKVADINPLFITPGIRLAGGDSHDQKHVATPDWAKRLGSDMIVVGRAIRTATDPGKAAAEIKAML